MLDPTDRDLVLQTVRDVAGEAGLKALRAAKGGTEIWVPLDPGPDHWMSRALGHEVATEVSRRLTVIDADGRRVCNMRCYVGIGRGRLYEFKAQIAQEVTDALLSGLNNFQVAAKVGVSARTVVRQRAELLDLGLLPVAQTVAEPARDRRGESAAAPDAGRAERTAVWDGKAFIVDEGLLRGHSNRRIAAEAHVGRTYIRMRRKMLFASGRLKPGRVSLAGTRPSDHSAKVGEMVRPYVELP